MSAKKLTCRNCGNPLTGQQRKWCSEACRKQAARDKKKRVRFLHQTSAFRPVSQSKLVEMRVIIDSKALQPYLYKSRNQLQNAIHRVMMSNRMAYLVATELEEKIPGYTFKVVVTFRR